MYWVHWRMARVATWCLGGITVSGLEKVPLTGPLIVASNHASYLDPPVIGGAMPRPISYMARKTLFNNPLFGWWISSLNAFPVDRDGDSRDALRTCCERIEQGGAVLMFPEGTRTETGRLAEVRRGIGTVAVRSGAPVLPVYLWGSYLSWPKGQGCPRRHRMRLHIGDPIETRDVPRGRARREEQDRIHAEVEAALHRLEREIWDVEGIAPESMPDAPAESEPSATDASSSTSE